MQHDDFAIAHHHANAMVAADKGLLSMDESNPTSNKRFAAPGISQTARCLDAYRERIVTTPRRIGNHSRH